MTWLQKSKRGRLSPFPNVLSMECITDQMKDAIGYSYEKVMIIFQDRMGFFFMDKEDSDRVEKLALEKAKEDPKIIKRITEKEEKLGKDLIEFAKNISLSNLKQKSNKELFELYKKYCEDYKIVYSNYFVILTMENPLLEFLKSYLDSKNLDEGTKSKYFATLTTSTKAMYSKEEEKELLKIGLETIEKIKKHKERYFWIPRDYEDPVWTEKEFMKRLKIDLNEEEIKNKLKEIEAFYEEKRKQIEEIEKKLDIDKSHSELFELLRSGVYLKELRKKIVSESLYYVDSLLTEIGKRTNLTIKQVRFLTLNDIEKALLYHQDIDFIDDRVKLSAFIIEKSNTIAYNGSETEKIMKEVITIDKDIKELKGLSASPGKFKGIAKIVFDSGDISKVNKGDIMVTVQAVPSFSPAIKIAGALLADGGTGLTSHPATLAREAGIPCVTGLKIATDIIKDGDIIEVDGDSGVVKL